MSMNPYDPINNGKAGSVSDNQDQPLLGVGGAYLGPEPVAVVNQPTPVQIVQVPAEQNPLAYNVQFPPAVKTSMVPITGASIGQSQLTTNQVEAANLINKASQIVGKEGYVTPDEVTYKVNVPSGDSMNFGTNINVAAPNAHDIYPHARTKIDLWGSAILLLLFEVLMCFMYGFFVRFEEQDTANLYNMSQDVNVMIFLGFGFLMSYLRYYAWSSIYISFLLATVAVQLFPLVGWFWERVFDGNWDEKVHMKTSMMIDAYFCAGSVLIGFGGLIGHATIFQVLIMALINIICYSLVWGIIFKVLYVQDIGGSIGIHLFGSTFGIVTMIVFGYKTPNPKNHPKNTSSYISNIFSAVGSIFLWMYWPSFNGALSVDDHERVKATLNTVICLTASAICTFALSPMLNKGKFSMEEILNATLSGGVIIGASCNLIISPAFSVGFGMIGGILTTLGFRYLSHWLHSKGMYDIVGITNLHFIPGFIGGIFSSFICAIYYEGDVRSASRQGGIQIACVFISLGIAAGAGIVSGLIMRLLARPRDILEDKELWHMEADD